MATYTVFNDIGCHKCNKQIKALRGCEKDVTPYEIIELKGYKFTRCPFLTAKEANYILDAYFEYKNGFLPNAGGWLDQPMKFSQFMIMVDNQIGELEKQNAGTANKYTP